jgi:hypothetical protein
VRASGGAGDELCPPPLAPELPLLLSRYLLDAAGVGESDDCLRASGEGGDSGLPGALCASPLRELLPLRLSREAVGADALGESDDCLRASDEGGDEDLPGAPCALLS